MVLFTADYIFRESQVESWTPTAGYTAPSPSLPDGWASRCISMIQISHSQNIPYCIQGTDVAHPGVASQDPEDKTEHVYHKYYQVRKHISDVIILFVPREGGLNGNSKKKFIMEVKTVKTRKSTECCKIWPKSTTICHKTVLSIREAFIKKK